MKKIIFICLLVYGTALFAQTDYLVVHLKNGETREFVLSDISKITFADSLSNVEENGSPDFAVSFKINANPALSSAEFSFSSEKPSYYFTKIYDMSGREVKTASFGYYLTSELNFSWDGTDNSGKMMPNGIYYCRMLFGDFVFSIKFIYFR